MSERFVCPPPDTGVTSLIYRLHDFPGVGSTLLCVGAVGLLSVGLFIVSVGATATPATLRRLYRCSLAAALVGLAPFVGSVVTIARRVLLELTRTGWRLQPFDPILAREVACSLILLLLGAFVATAPAVAAAVCKRRLDLATHRDLNARERRRAAGVAGALVAAQLAGLKMRWGGSRPARS